MISPTGSSIKRRGVEESEEEISLVASPSKVPLIIARASSTVAVAPTSSSQPSSVRPISTRIGSSTTPTGTRVVSTFRPVAQTSCAPGSAPSARPNLAAILASANTFGQGKPQVAIIIAWLLESFAIRCYIEHGPVRDTFACMGDSYGAGIGAGKPFQMDPVDKCKRGEFALGPQLFKEQDIWWNSNQSHVLDFLACSGARAYDMFKAGNGLQGHAGQDKEFTYVQDDLAALWVGGNDIGFFEIMDGCVYQFNLALAPSCSKAVQNANDLIKATGPASAQANIMQVYDEIMSGSNPRSSNFTLYVLGYAQFWNANTDFCNDSQMAFWTRWAGPKLTKENRAAMNTVLINLNNMLRNLVAKISANLRPGRRIIYVDIDPLFEGHRFCDHKSEPNPINAKNYFFQMNDQDTLPDGTNYDNVPFWPDKPSTLGVPAYPGVNDAATCRSLLSGSARNSMLYGELAFCEISIMLADNPGVSLEDTLYMRSDGGGQIGKQYDIMKYNRVFHPKTIGYAKVKDKVMSMIRADQAAGLL
ncbi:SGNH hydrolase-type esterase domain-containing protein [Tricladium varicosporioides]|nr:SGNH hydrolase-type esterase domain-containing protein [Hymenoscyphus varicosporioides]